ncbi:hypothetical protein EPO05_05050 [Patescibacteria group bacterium]|nr:MAG: hypothetical protein EPO05_05050 [Patescibacteria group bacterium]
MLLNCQQLHEQLQKFSELKRQFDVVLEAGELDAAKSLEVEIEGMIKLLGEAIGTPEERFNLWAKKHGIEGEAEWMGTVAIGDKTKEEIISGGGLKEQTYLAELIRRPGFVVSERIEKAGLVLMPLSALGAFRGRGTCAWKEILSAAKEYQLDYCPHEVGPEIIRQDMTVGRSPGSLESISIAMQPIFWRKRRRIFCIDYLVGHKKVLAETTVEINGDYLNLEHRYIFRFRG